MAESTPGKGPDKGAPDSLDVLEVDDIIIDDLRDKSEELADTAKADADAIAEADRLIREAAAKAGVDVTKDEDARLKEQDVQAKLRVAELFTEIDAILAAADAVAADVEMAATKLKESRTLLRGLSQKAEKEDIDKFNTRAKQIFDKATSLDAAAADAQAKADAKAAEDAAKAAARVVLAPEAQAALDAFTAPANAAFMDLVSKERAQRKDPSVDVPADEYVKVRALATKAYAEAKKSGSTDDMEQMKNILTVLNDRAERSKDNNEWEGALKTQLAELRKKLIATEASKGGEGAAETIREQYESTQAELKAAGLLNAIDERVQLTNERMRNLEALFGDGVGRWLLSQWNKLGQANVYEVGRYLMGADKNIQGQPQPPANESWGQAAKRWATTLDVPKAVGVAILRMGSARTGLAMLATGAAATVFTGGGFAAATALGAFGAAALGVGKHDATRAKFRTTETQKNIDLTDLDSKSLADLEQMAGDMEVRVVYNGIDLNDTENPAAVQLRQQYESILKAIEAKQLAPEAAEAQAKKLQEVLALNHSQVDAKLAQFRDADQKNARKAVAVGAAWGAVGFGLGAGFRLWNGGYFSEPEAAPAVPTPQAVSEPAPESFDASDISDPWKDSPAVGAVNDVPTFGAPGGPMAGPELPPGGIEAMNADPANPMLGPSVPLNFEAPIDPSAPGAPSSDQLTDAQIQAAIQFQAPDVNPSAPGALPSEQLTDAQIQAAIQFEEVPSNTTTSYTQEALAAAAKAGEAIRVELGEASYDIFMVGDEEGFTYAYLDYIKDTAEAQGYDPSSGVSLDKWAKKLLLSKIKNGDLKINGVEYNPYDPNANQQLWVMEPNRYGFSFTTNADGTVNALPHDMQAGGAVITEAGALDKAFDTHTIKAPAPTPEPAAAAAQPEAPEPQQPSTGGVQTPEPLPTAGAGTEGPLAIPFDGAYPTGSGEGALAIPYDGEQPTGPGLENQMSSNARLENAATSAARLPEVVDGKFSWKAFLANNGLESQKQYWALVGEQAMTVGATGLDHSVAATAEGASDTLLETLRDSNRLVLGDGINKIELVFNGQGDVVREFVGVDRISDQDYGDVLFADWEQYVPDGKEALVEADAAKLTMLQEGHRLLAEKGLGGSDYDKALTKAAERIIGQVSKFGPVLAADLRPTDASY